jgi:hypothetical protein
VDEPEQGVAGGDQFLVDLLDGRRCQPDRGLLDDGTYRVCPSTRSLLGVAGPG